MNGIRIRPFEAAARIAALTLLTGCSLLKFSVDTGGEPLSKEETRMRLLTRGFYYEASDEVTAAADSIAAGSDDALRLVPPRKMSLEQCLEFLADDELLEVTPKNLRIRKTILNHERRMKAQHGKKN